MSERRRAALYLRVSSDVQSVENQRPEVEQLVRVRALEVVNVFEETASATKARPAFDAMMARAKAGGFDVLVVWALDRFGRSMLGNLAAVLELDRIGVTVVSVRETWLDTGGPVRSLLVAIFSWVAEQERMRLVERTRAGLQRARREGRTLGRPRVAVDLDAALTLRRRGVSLTRAAERLGVGRSTLARALSAYRRSLSPKIAATSGADAARDSASLAPADDG